MYLRCYTGIAKHDFLGIWLLWKGPMIVWRVACPCCKEGIFNISGDSTKERSVQRWNTNIRMSREIMDENSDWRGDNV